MPDQSIKQVFVQFTADSSQMRQEMAKDTQAVQTLRDQITAAGQRISQAQENIGKWPPPKGLQEAADGLKSIEPGAKKAAAGLAGAAGGAKEMAAGVKAAAIPLVNQLAPGLGAVVGASSMMAQGLGGLGPMAVGVGIAITGLAIVISDVVGRMKEQVEWQNKIAEAKVGTGIANATSLFQEQSKALREANRELERQAKGVGILEGTWNVLTNAYGRQRAAQSAATAKVMQTTAALDEQWSKIEEGRVSLDILEMQAKTSEAAARAAVEGAKGTAALAATNQDLNRVLAEQLDIQRQRTELRIKEIAEDQGMTPAMRAAETEKALAELNAAEQQFFIEKTARDNATIEKENQAREAAENSYRETIQRERNLLAIRAQLGEATMAQELAFLQRRATDARASGEEQLQARVDLAARLKQIDDTYFSIRRTLGDATLKDEVQRQKDIVAATQAGTQQRLQAEQDLATKTQQLREASMSAFERGVSQAAKALEEKGQAITLGNITAELQKNAQQGIATLQDLQAGMAVTARDGQSGFERLTAAIGSAGLQKAFTEVGGVTEGLQRGLGGFLEDLGAKAKATQDGMRDLVETARQWNLDAGLTRMEQSFNKSFDVILNATDNFITTLSGKIQAGTSTLAQNLYEGFVGRLVTDLQAEARRS